MLCRKEFEMTRVSTLFFLLLAGRYACAQHQTLQMPAEATFKTNGVQYRTLKVDNLEIFYREAGPRDAETILLLHGFPSSSFMFRNLINDLKDKYHVIAPDYPGFGFSSFPDASAFEYSFENISVVMEHFVDALKLKKFSLYIQDYGSPVGMRLIRRRPELLHCLLVQNGNAYEEGLGQPWDPIKAFWQNPQLAENKKAILDFFELPVTKFQYEAGVSNKANISPESYYFDQQFLDRKGSKEVQLQLMYDYRTNVKEYVNWQKTLRQLQPPTLVVWGENDPFFTKAGALAYGRDIKDIDYHFYPTGHFALEEFGEEIARQIDSFLSKRKK
jgi:pimeloyl-ACP methyl ester carboxylesterase